MGFPLPLKAGGNLSISHDVHILVAEVEIHRLYLHLQHPVHLRMLSQLARDLMDDDFRDGLLCASSIEDIKKCLGNCETHS